MAAASPRSKGANPPTDALAAARAAKMEGVQDQVEDVTQSMQTLISKGFRRGDDLDTLTEKSYLLRDQSQRFHRSASDVKSTIRKRSWATIAKMVACLLLLLAIIGLIIYLSLYFASNR